MKLGGIRRNWNKKENETMAGELALVLLIQIKFFCRARQVNEGLANHATSLKNSITFIDGLDEGGVVDVSSWLRKFTAEQLEVFRFHIDAQEMQDAAELGWSDIACVCFALD
jgi:hypothetical protein